MPNTASFTCRVCAWRPARRPDGGVKRPPYIPSGYDTVIELNTQLGQCILHLGWLELVTRSTKELVPLEDQAIRLSPRVPKAVFGMAG